MADESLELLSNHIAAAGKVWIVDLFPARTLLPPLLDFPAVNTAN